MLTQSDLSLTLRAMRKKLLRAKLNITSSLEGPDHQRELMKKPMTEDEMKDNIPPAWRRHAKAARDQISIPIPGTDFYT